MCTLLEYYNNIELVQKEVKSTQKQPSREKMARP